MAVKPFLAFAVLCGLCLAAKADDATQAPPKLPTFAMQPQVSSADPQ